MQEVKNQAMLARAFVRAIALQPAACGRARGYSWLERGRCLADVRRILHVAGLMHAGLAARRTRAIFRTCCAALDCFVLPSLTRGHLQHHSGGDGERTAGDRDGRGQATRSSSMRAPRVNWSHPEITRRSPIRLLEYAGDRARSRRAGAAGRARVERLYSLNRMVSLDDLVHANAQVVPMTTR